MKEGAGDAGFCEVCEVRSGLYLRKIFLNWLWISSMMSWLLGCCGCCCVNPCNARVT